MPFTDVPFHPTEGEPFSSNAVVSQSRFPNLSNICNLYVSNDLPLGRKILDPELGSVGYKKLGTIKLLK